MRTYLVLFFTCIAIITFSQGDQDSLAVERSIKDLTKSIQENKGLSDSTIISYYLELSDLYKSKKEYDISIKYCDTIIERFKDYDFETLSDIRVKRALLYKTAGKTDVTIKQLLELLSDVDKRGDSKISANLSNRIGIIFLKMNELKDAEYYLNESIKHARDAGEPKIEASSLMSLGNRFKKENRFDEAEKQYMASIAICMKYGYKKFLAGNYNNYGSLLRMKGELDESLQYYKLAVKINEEIGNDAWLSYNYNNIGNIYKQKKNYAEALKYFDLSLDIKTDLGDDAGQVQTLQNLANTYESLGRHAEAYDFLNRHIKLKDSLDKLDRLEQTKELAAQFQAEKREAEIIQLNMKAEMNQQELDAADERLRYQNFLSWMFGIGIFLVLIVAVLIWRSSIQRKKANVELEAKNEQIDEKNREIIDSINYAKRIQNSILPGEKRRSKILGWHGLLYRPKDIVSGDFYICDETDDRIYFGTVDCTGHGVPGAMVSIVASSSFNKALHEMKITEPDGILTQLNEDIPKVLDADQEGVNDGMDMALVSLDKGKKEMKFAGAFQNCWVFNSKETFDDRVNNSKDMIRFDNEHYTLCELKGVRRGIGMSESNAEFKTINFPLVKGDKILLSTDGFQDQFGGQNNKKFKIRQLRKVVLENANLSPDVLIDTLNSSLKKWQGDEEQIDDICVFVVEV